MWNHVSTLNRGKMARRTLTCPENGCGKLVDNLWISRSCSVLEWAEPREISLSFRPGDGSITAKTMILRPSNCDMCLKLFGLAAKAVRGENPWLAWGKRACTLAKPPGKQPWEGPRPRREWPIAAPQWWSSLRPFTLSRRGTEYVPITIWSRMLASVAWRRAISSSILPSL